MTRIFRFFTTIILILVLFMSPLQEVTAFASQSVSKTPPGKSFTIPPGQSKKLEHDEAVLEVGAGSVLVNTTITIEPLVMEDLPTLDQGMSNVTDGPRYGYRMLPHHTAFNKKITIMLPYDIELIPAGMTENDIKTFFFDDQAGTWQELERVKVDTNRKLVVSLTNHFTDFINATLTVPDHPETLSYDPNTIQGIKAADPGAAINLIEPPQGNAMGGANLSYPIEIPPGRGGMQPQLSVNYNSEGGNGWMGLGWDLAIPSISIDTRWGVPLYDLANETETYLLNGEMLTPVAHRGSLQARSSEKVFHARVESQFQQIIRHGNSPSSYWWEVIDKNGTRSFYGGSPDNPGGVDSSAVLADPAGEHNIFQWMLREVRDLDDNTIRYNYVVVEGGAGGGEPWRQIYLDGINYTGTAGTNDWHYEVQFTTAEGRPDTIIDGRAGFKTVLSKRLAAVDVFWLSADTHTLIRRYEFTYQEGQFGKSLLGRITQFGEDGVSELAHHDFEYFDEVATTAADDQINAFNSTSTSTGAQICSDSDLLLIGVKSTALGCDVTKSHEEQASAGISLTGTGVGAAVNQSYSWANTNSKLSLLDLNGDGLLDQVFQSGNQLYYRPNTGNTSAALMFAPSIPISLPRVPHETSETLSLGGNVGDGALSGQMAWTWSNADVYFSDVNADLLPDLVIGGRNGTILYNRLVNGVPTFLPNNPIPMVPGASADTDGMVQQPPQLEQAELDDKTNLVDPLRLWVAPYSGTIAISGETYLLEAGYGTADGVRVSIQHNEQEIWASIIDDPTDLEPRLISGLEAVTVNVGDRIYFRVNSRNDGSSDVVAFSPTITYLGVDTTQVDENGNRLFIYDSALDFAYGGRPILFTAPFTGTATLSGIFEKSEVTTDDIVLQIRKGNDLALIYDMTLSADQTGKFPVNQPLDLNTGDALQLWIETDTRVDLSGISFLPRLSYTTVDGQDVPLVDGEPALFFNLAASSRIYPRNTSTSVYSPFVADRDGTLKVHWAVEGIGSTPDDYTGAITLAIKRPGERLAKQRIEFVNGSIDGTSELGTSIEVLDGDVLYFVADSTDEGSADAFVLNVNILAPELAYLTEDTEEQIPSPDFDVHLAISSDEAFGGGYRQWWYGQYNGEEGAMPIDESRLRLPTSQDDPIVDEFIQMVPYVEMDGMAHWRIQDEECWIGPEAMSASRLGTNYLDFTSNSDVSGNRAIVRQGGAESLGGNMSIGVAGGGITTGTNWSDIDFLDFNGDSYPDIVGGGKVQATLPNGALGEQEYTLDNFDKVRKSENKTWNVNVGPTMTLQNSDAQGNLKNSSTSNKSVSLGVGVNGSWGDFWSLSDLIDINGDGLLDLVRRSDDGILVRLNLGYHFGAIETWAIPQPAELKEIRLEKSLLVGLSGSVGVNLGLFSLGGGVSDTESTTATMQNLIDVNGDGLPDLVYKAIDGLDSPDDLINLTSVSEEIRVFLNTGSGFAAAPLWFQGAMQQPMSAQKTTSRNVSVQAGISIPLGPISIDLGGGYSYGASLGGSAVLLTDINGDGYADHFFSNTNGDVALNLNNHGKTNLLKTVRRPLGAEITLDYQRGGNTIDDPYSHWNLARVEVFDGQPGDGTDTQLTTYSYEGGRYDRLEREFYGYQKVIAEERDTLNNGAFYRATVRGFSNNSYYTKGLLTSEVVQGAAGAKFIETVYTYVLRDEETKHVPGNMQSTTARLFPMFVRTDQRYYEGSPYGVKTTYTTMAYDDWGNVVFFFDAGDRGELDNVSAIVEYSNCQDIYVMSVPKSIVVTGGDTIPLRNRDAEVDCETGDVTQVRQYLADGSVVVTDLDYFPNGNLKQVTGPANLHGLRYQLTYEYDPFVQTYVTRITDSFGYSSTAVYNYKYGAVESTVDLNGNKIAYIYDMFGRLTSVTGPNEQGGSTPTIQFDYHPDAVVPWALTRHLDTFRNPADPIETVLFTDGLKRVLQTKKDGTIFTGSNGQTQDVMTVSGRVRFDFAGRATEQYYPVTEPLGTPGVFNPTYDSIQPTRITYDILDRQTLVTLPNNTSTAYSYGFGSDRDGMTQFETTVTDANGMQSQSYKNVQNLVVSLKQFNQGGSQVIWTSYTYNPLKQLSEVMDDQGNTTRVEYDNLGRQTVVDSPDAGRTETIYDLASNVTARITANLHAEGQQISYDYEYGRLKSISYPDYPDNNVTYAYGALGAAYNRAGRITWVKSQAGTAELFYGRLGEVVKEVNTVATFVPGNKATYTTTFLYDNWGRLQTLGYPDGEVLTYRYDSGGLVCQVSGTKGKFSYDYIRRMEYDKFGQVAFTETGNNVRTQYTYQPENRRLENLQAGKGQGNPFQNLNYTYDNVGNVLSLTNDVPIAPASQFGGPTAQTFQYDDLYRLVGAEGYYQFSPGKINGYILSMSYDSINNILSKQQIHEITQPSGTLVAQQKTTYDWAYTYDGSQPHAATHIGDLTFTYDANGNQLGWSNDLNGTRRAIIWDEENRIQSIFDNGQEMTYKYDAAGQRVIKRGPQGETVTVNQYYTVRNATLGTKHIYVGETRMASKLVKSNSREKDQYYYHPDQLGSSNYVTDANGQVYEHMEYFPSGETWVQEAGNTQRTPYLFTGKELDEETGLYYYGARYYDPRTSLWQSPDPALADYLSNPSSGDVYNPANLSLYAYAAQNPVKYVDPDGQKIKIVGDWRFIDRVNMAKNYLMKSEKARDLWNELANRAEVITIQNVDRSGAPGTCRSDCYDGNQTIYWNPFAGLTTSAGDQSPALGLIHEVGHALMDVKDRPGYLSGLRTAPINPDNYNKEEERNLAIESTVAGQLGEPSRTTYKDAEDKEPIVFNPTIHTNIAPAGPVAAPPKPVAPPKTRIQQLQQAMNLH